MDQAKFREALERALEGRSQVEVAREAGVAPSTISTWLGGGGAEPSKVFAVEAATGKRPGELSRHLGYVPVGEERIVSVTEAVEADEDLDDPDRDALLFLYNFFKRRSVAVTIADNDAAKTTRQSRRASSR